MKNRSQSTTNSSILQSSDRANSALRSGHSSNVAPKRAILPQEPGFRKQGF